MRICSSILIASFFTCACCYGQGVEQTSLAERLNNPKLDKRTNIVMEFQSKKFEGSGPMKLRKAPDVDEAFAYDKKNATAGTYKEVRTFFGIKNPWFGKKVFVVKDASLFSKSAMPNLEKEYAVKEEKVRPFYQEDRTTEVKEAYDPKTFYGQGSRKGSLAKISEMMEKEMTVEQVRELLNKNN